MRLLALALLALAATACETPRKKPLLSAVASFGPPELEEIAALEDRRSLGSSGRLESLATQGTSPAIRARAFLALGRIQDPATLPTVVKGLRDTEVTVRAQAAFAAGLMGLSWQPLPDEAKRTLSQAVEAAEEAEGDAEPKLKLLEALGRLATPSAMERLTDRLAAGGVELQARAALSLGLGAKFKGTVPARAIPALVNLLKRDVPALVRQPAAYALMQARAPASRAFLLLCTQDEEAEIRAVCAKGLGEVGADADAVTLKKLLDDPASWVVVESTRSLAKLAGRCKSAACPALGALQELTYRVERLARGDVPGGAYPLLTLAQEGLPLTGRPLLASLRTAVATALEAAQGDQTRKDLALVECRLAAALDRLDGQVKEVLSCGKELVPEARRLVFALGELATSPADAARRAAALTPYLTASDARVRLKAIEAAGETKLTTLAETLKAQLEGDPILAAAAVGALAKLKDTSVVPRLRTLLESNSSRPEVVSTLAQAAAALEAKDAIPDLEKLLTSTQATIRHEAAAALTKLKGQPVLAANVESPPGPPPDALPDNPSLRVRTVRGSFEVKLDAAAAPRTVRNIFALARRDFFRGHTFHRIVPGFVAQGGDPRGDGEGGPGYTIRCEANARPYTRGAVGMALGGKDTGGSQFFVMTQPAPHLDGRYTGFGEVMSGQEVVDALLEGDAILEVTALPEPPRPPVRR